VPVLRAPRKLSGRAHIVTSTVPQAKYALIGGSGTWGMRFPEDLGRDDIELVEVFDQGFETPYGRSITFKLLRVAGELVLRTAMHGVRYGDEGFPVEPPWQASQQVASVLRDAGVKWALVEASVGGIQSPDEPGAPLPPWSVTITDDFMMLGRASTSGPAPGKPGEGCQVCRTVLRGAASGPAEPGLGGTEVRRGLRSRGVSLRADGALRDGGRDSGVCTAGRSRCRTDLGTRGAADAPAWHTLCLSEHRLQSR